MKTYKSAYKEYMDSVRAPEELLSRTAQRMQSAEQPQERKPVIALRRFLPAVCTAAAAALLFIVLLPGDRSESSVIWQTVDIRIEKELSGTDTQKNGGMEIGAAALPSTEELGEMFPGFEIVKTDISGTTAVYYLRKGNNSVRYLISTEESAVPEEFAALEPQNCGGKEVYFAASADGLYHYAVWRNDGIVHFVTAGNFSEADLSEFLKKIF